VKLYHITSERNHQRILLSGFDPLDCLVGSSGILMFDELARVGGDKVVEVEVPEDVARRHAIRSSTAPRALFYHLPVEVANHYLRGA
jgi:hypothetical protein